MTFSFTQVLTTNSQFFPLIINTYNVTTPFDRLIVDRDPLDAEGEQIAEDLHTGDVYASFVVTADGEGTRYDIALNNDAIDDLQAAINRGDQFFSIGLANASFNTAGFFTPGDATLEVSVIVFAGTPGAASCPVPSSAYPTIQAAVDNVTCGTINVAAGTYTEHVVISRDVTIRGEDQERTIVDGSPVVTIISGAVTIKNVTIQNGGGIENRHEGTLIIQDSTIANNSSGSVSGGGINNFGVLTIHGSTIANNRAPLRDGGGINNDGTLTIKDSIIADNSATNNGGGINNNSRGIVTLRDVIFQNNTPNDCTGCP